MSALVHLIFNTGLGTYVIVAAQNMFLEPSALGEAKMAGCRLSTSGAEYPSWASAIEINGNANALSRYSDLPWCNSCVEHQGRDHI